MKKNSLADFKCDMERFIETSVVYMGGRLSFLDHVVGL